jgi:CDP-glucose 4,6-dehydratase
MKKTIWRDHPVFVTGCTGLLGSWLTKTLVNEKANVIGLVRDNTPKSHFYREGLDKQITIVRGDIEDYALIERVINEYEVETIFHLGAQTIVTIANKGPIATFKANIEGTWNVLEVCRQISSVKRLVVASSDKAYGDQDHLPYDESTPLQGKHPYDVSKSCADLICQTYYETYGVPVCVTRCGNLFGGGDLNFNRIIPGTIRALCNNERPVIRSDGSYLRDYFYIQDAVESYLLLAEKMNDKKIHGEAFNFSNESPKTVSEVVNTISSLMKSHLEPIILNNVKNEIRNQYLSAKKAHDLLKWRPHYSINDGLRETIQWYKHFFENPCLLRGAQ